MHSSYISRCFVSLMLLYSSYRNAVLTNQHSELKVFYNQMIEQLVSAAAVQTERQHFQRFHIQITLKKGHSCWKMGLYQVRDVILIVCGSSVECPKSCFVSNQSLPSAPCVPLGLQTFPFHHRKSFRRIPLLRVPAVISESRSSLSLIVLLALLSLASFVAVYFRCDL